MAASGSPWSAAQTLSTRGSNASYRTATSKPCDTATAISRTQAWHPTETSGSSARRDPNDDIIPKRTDLVRIDREGGVTEFRAPRIGLESIAPAADGTVSTAGIIGRPGNVVGVLARMNATGRFERIFRAPAWEVHQMRAAPDGRLWLTYQSPGGDSAAWLPPNPCLSRRRITVHPRSRRGDPIRNVRVSVQGRLPRTFHGPHPSIPIDLRGYLPGAVGVTLKVRAAHHRYTRHRVYHTCTSTS